MAKAESTGLNARIRALNDHWRRRSPVRRRGVKDWVCGGVTCESKYESAPVRVLWLLRDTNKALKEDSLPVLLRYLVKKEPELGTSKYLTYGAVAKATKLLTGQEAASLGDVLETIAVLNLKKTPGKGASVPSDLMWWAENTPELLREEIAILGPDVVVAGGTFCLLCRHVLPDDANTCRYADEHCRRIRLGDLCSAAKGMNKKVCVLDSYHPRARREQAKSFMCDARRWGRECRRVWAKR